MDDPEKQPRFRSPPYPYIGLGRALAKAEELYGSVRHYAAAMPTAAKAWGTGVKSSATLQITAALLQYDLVDDEGSGNTRKLKLSPLALKIIMDKRPDSTDRVDAIKIAALSPKIFSELFGQFQTADGIDDSLLVHELTGARIQQGKAPYSEQAARDVVRVYRDTLSFAGLSDSDKKNEESPMLEEEPNAAPGTAAKVGDFVQWVSAGVAQFAEPKRVRAVSDDGSWAFVEGSTTGLDMSELEIVAAPRPSRPPSMALPEDEPTVHDRADPREKGRMKVVWEGSLIHISATVDKAGLAQLRNKLDAMETLLGDD